MVGDLGDVRNVEWMISFYLKQQVIKLEVKDSLASWHATSKAHLNPFANFCQESIAIKYEVNFPTVSY